MTDTLTWRGHVAAMVAKCAAQQDELFYRLALPGWEAELRRLEGGDDPTLETADLQSHQKEQRT